MKFPKNQILNSILAAIFIPIGIGVAADENERLEIENASGQKVAVIEELAEGMRISYSVDGVQKKLEGSRIDDRKRKWRSENGTIEAEIKFDGEDFKLRKPDGSLLWKVKFYPGEKIKISDNEENENPYEIRMYPGEPRLKLKHEDREIGQVKWYADSGKVKFKKADGTDLFTRKASRLSPDLAVFLIEGASLRDQVILAAELWLAASKDK